MLVQLDCALGLRVTQQDSRLSYSPGALSTSALPEAAMSAQARAEAGTCIRMAEQGGKQRAAVTCRIKLCSIQQGTEPRTVHGSPAAHYCCAALLRLSAIVQTLPTCWQPAADLAHSLRELITAAVLLSTQQRSLSAVKHL